MRALLDQQAATAGLLFRSNSTAPPMAVRSYPLATPQPSPPQMAVRTASSSSGLALRFTSSDDPLLSVLRKQADVSAKLSTV